jgi:MoxR-like ATPase
MPDEGHPSQAAWNDFADAMKRIGEKITGPTGARNARERAEGYRYLLRLIAAAHALEAEADRRHPVLTRIPTRATEEQVLKNYLAGFDPSDLGRMGLNTVLDVPTLVQMQQHLGTIRVDPELLSYITDIVSRTRAHPSVYLGASPRASIALLVTARAQAAAEGRDFVVPDDVKSFAPAVLRHRLILHPDAELENVTADNCVESILREAKVPKTAA